MQVASNMPPAIAKQYEEFKAKRAKHQADQLLIDSQNKAEKQARTERYKLGNCKQTKVEHPCHSCGATIPKFSRNIKTRPSMITNPRTRDPRMTQVYFCHACQPEEVKA